MSAIQTISILGCGWYGFALAESLIKKGFRVKGSSTAESKFPQMELAGILPFLIAFDADSETWDQDFFACDLLIICIPPKRRSGEANAYPLKIARIKNIVISHSIQRVLFISSSSVYGDHNREVSEESLAEPDTDSGRAILEAENLLKANPQFSTAILRFGGLFGPARDPARFFAGKKDIPNGKAPVNLIHLNDCISLTHAVIEKQAFGETFNACSSEHPKKMTFYTEACKRSGTELPEFIAGLKEWKIVSSAKAENLLGRRIRLEERERSK